MHPPARLPSPIRRFSFGLVALAFAVGVAGVGCDSGSAEWDGNVILVVIDTLRADRLPFYGCEKDTAPFLNELATNSVLFESAWSTSSWTAPATASIFTGTYPNQHGVVTNLRIARLLEARGAPIEVNRIPESFETIPLFLRSQGYRTFGVSSNPNVDSRRGFDRGFDRFAMINYHDGGDASTMVARLLEWKSEIAQAERFFLYVHLMDPHGPYVRHEQWIPENERPKKPNREDRGAYDSEIRYADEQIRRLFSELPLGDALAIVTSDHGQEFKDHGNIGHHFQLYSELTRALLIIRLPGSEPRRVAGHVSIVDILPTLRTLLGAPTSPRDAGRSLLGGDSPADSREAVYAMRTELLRDTLEKRAVISGRFKLIRTNSAENEEAMEQTELYDLVADPSETYNLATERPAIRRDLGELLAAQARAGDVAAWEKAESFVPSASEIEMLEDLGYVTE
jgi:arylsulfatase A-like enzyme